MSADSKIFTLAYDEPLYTFEDCIELKIFAPGCIEHTLDELQTLEEMREYNSSLFGDDAFSKYKESSVSNYHSGKTETP